MGTGGQSTNIPDPMALPSRGWYSRRWVTAAGLVLALGGCHRGPPPPMVLDLVEAAPAADLESAWDVVRFGTPSAAPMLEKGFGEGMTPPWSDPWIPTKLKPQILFRWASL